MFVLCARCRKPSSLDAAPEGEFVCADCLGAPVSAFVPRAEDVRPDVKLRTNSRDLWEMRRRDWWISLPLIGTVAGLLIGGMAGVAPAGPGPGAVTGALLLGCFLVYTAAVWYATTRSIEDYVPVWKCSLLALILIVMEILAVSAVIGGRGPSCGALVAAGAGGWFIYSMLYRAFFRVHFALAMAATFVAAGVAVLGTALFMCVGGAIIGSLAR